VSGLKHHHGAGQGRLGRPLLQGHAGCIGVGQLAQELLQGQSRRQTLQISHQGQTAIVLTLPTDAVTAVELHAQVDRYSVLGKARYHAASAGLQTQRLETGRQGIHITQDRWQDGQVGHELMPALPNPSQNVPSIQWPLPPQAAQMPPLRLAVLASGEGTNFEALVTACRDGLLAPAEVVQLIINNPGCGAQQRAERLGVAWELVDHRHCSRVELDHALVRALGNRHVDLVVMAGWMRIVTPVLIGAYSGRLVNIHPSLLPSFRGLDAVGQALAAGVQLSGCTVHLVDEAVDSGEILMQAAVPVLQGDDHASLSARIQIQEHRLLPAALAVLGQRLARQPQG